MRQQRAYTVLHGSENEWRYLTDRKLGDGKQVVKIALDDSIPRDF